MGNKLTSKPRRNTLLMTGQSCAAGETHRAGRKDGQTALLDRRAPPELARGAKWLVFMAGCKGGDLGKASRRWPPEWDSLERRTTRLRKAACLPGELLQVDHAA
jgi:hypothetical protein